MPPADRFPEGARLGVVTTEPLGRGPALLDYRAPEGGCRTGDFVRVPLGPRKVPGVVWGPGAGDVPSDKLRVVDAVLDVPPMTEAMRSFLERAADYTLTPLPAMLRLATRVPDLGQPPPVMRLVRATGHRPDRMTPARRRVLDTLAAYGGAAMAPADLAAEAGVSSGVLSGLVGAGALIEALVPRDAPLPRLDPCRPGPELSAAQEGVARRLRADAAAGGFRPTLLKGVTGSGKTEVYLEAVGECLRQGRQALVLMPEIALTAGFLGRVEERFGARPGEWHSGIGPADRRRLWSALAEGGPALVVGARSALFLPFAALGLIVVDEEHDASYKQEDGVLYHARDMAVLRASIEDCPTVLASATPSLETWVNARTGRYARLDLPARFGVAEMPEMRAIDLRGTDLASGRWISAALAEAATARIGAGEQTLLFLNRRGYAPVTVCRACGQQIGCTDCDARMVEHRFQNRLVCHRCGASRPIPVACPACGVEGRLAAVGPGVERLAEEAAALWPEARIRVLSSDLFASARALKDEIAAIAAGEADIVIGTQIVAKGHNFPLLTLVGVIDADLGLMGSDLRAAERSFQLIAQVAGRAGRADRPGLALLQTHQPDHPVIRAILAGADEAFWEAEAEARRAAGMPPFGRLAGIILSGPDPAPLFEIGQTLAREDHALRAVGARVWGPAPAPVARIRGRHRVRLLVRAERAAPIQAAIRNWLAPVRLPGAIRLAVDIDPQSFL
ncbi:MAG: primosomal protein N' [Gemmobacter sp.]